MSIGLFAADKEIIIGLRAHIGIEESLKHWQATADFLSERIDGHSFKLVPYARLNDLSAAANRGEFNYVITNPSSYIDMEINSDGTRMLTLINKRQGKPFTQFGSVIFVRTERKDINSIDDLRGKRLRAVSEPAFGGWQVAWGELLKRDIDPQEDLKELSFAGTQHKVVYAVRDGKVDAGVVRTDMLERMAESGLINLSDFRSLGQRESEAFPFLRSTDLYPEWAFVRFKSTPMDLSRKVIRALLDITPDSRAATTGKYIGWSVPLNYEPVHELLRTLKVGPYENYGQVSLGDTLDTYRYWIFAILFSLFAASSFALLRSRQLVELRSNLLEHKDRELDFQKIAIDEHAIVSITDVKGDIIRTNSKFAEISGYQQDELIGQNHRILKSDEHSPSFYKDFWKAIASGITWHGEIKNRARDGRFYWIKSTIVPFLNVQGKPSQYISIGTDITERIAAEHEVAAANQAKSEFLSSMSHELRTPMNAILGFAQILGANTKEPLTEKQQSSVDHILKGGYHLMELIDQVLDLARIETGKMAMSIEEVLVSKVGQECLAMIEKQVQERGLKLESNLGSNHIIAADYTRFKQILLNLLSNAIKYNRKGGNISLTAEVIPDKFVRVTVSDTGVGITRDNQAHLFEPFNRLGKETGGIDGTGIGLTITRQLVEAVGGRIGFKSKVGEGSRFWVDMPVFEGHSSLSEVDAQTQQGIAQEEQPDLRGVILYIEDNPANLRLMEQVIGNMSGITLISAHNAELGLLMAEERLPDLILMDINLPGMNGIEALKQLRGATETCHIPVIAITAAVREEDIKRGLVAGFEAYLTKPFKVKEVIEAINRQLSA